MKKKKREAMKNLYFYYYLNGPKASTSLREVSIAFSLSFISSFMRIGVGELDLGSKISSKIHNHKENG
jgi:hypothetical protein